MLKSFLRASIVVLIVLTILALALPAFAQAPEGVLDLDVTGTALAGFMLLLFLATAGERLSEYFIKPVIVIVSKAVNRPDLQEAADYVERLVCIIPGAGMVILLQIDIFGFMGLQMPLPWGVIITAFVVGGGTNLLHDFVKAIPDGT